MKNKISILIALSLLVFAVLGCSSLNPFGSGDSARSSNSSSNKTVTDKAVDVAVGESKVGIPECDDLIEAINAEMDNPDDGVIAKAFKRTILNRIKDSIRDSLANNTAKDREEMIKTCRDFKAEFDKFKADEAAKKTEAQ